ncbi:hypothetical protein K438DRAFT_1768758 [Mycena galopus ATCC 62051]|nr:hypothetical protein K438DRAFT_1768758 [Mycena galopus ATCC 62051]
MTSHLCPTCALCLGSWISRNFHRSPLRNALKDKGAEILHLDVIAPPSEISAFAATAWAIHKQIDFLVHNAGYLQGGAIKENSPPRRPVSGSGTGFCLDTYPQPGFCRTAVAESAGRGLHRIPEYTLPYKAWINRIAAAGTERGDPPKAAVKILEFVTSAEQEFPLRLFGDDSFENLKAFHQQRLHDIEQFKARSVGTDCDYTSFRICNKWYNEGV